MACVVLSLLWFGVAGILIVGHTDLMYVIWPSSILLLVGWSRTPLGIMITLPAVVINCLLYGAAAVLLRGLVRWIANAEGNMRSDG